MRESNIRMLLSLVILMMQINSWIGMLIVQAAIHSGVAENTKEFAILVDTKL